jgi:hypothetical protein
LFLFDVRIFFGYFDRLAIVHAVHESRGLDQSPKMVSQLISYGDKLSATMLEEIEKVHLFGKRVPLLDLIVVLVSLG